MSFDPIFGAGFSCPAGNSLRVSAGAANAWRRSFFVPVLPAESVPYHKKQAEHCHRIGVSARNLAQKARLELAAGLNESAVRAIAERERKRRSGGFQRAESK